MSNRNPKGGKIPYIKQIMGFEDVDTGRSPEVLFRNIVKLQITFLEGSFEHIDFPLPLSDIPYVTNYHPFMNRPDYYEVDNDAIVYCTQIMFFNGIEFDTDYKCLKSRSLLGADSSRINYCYWKNCGREIKQNDFNES